MTGEPPVEPIAGDLDVLLEALPMPVFYKSTDLRYRRVNRAVCEFFDRPCEGIVGLTDRELFPSEVATRFERDERALLASGESLAIQDQLALDGQGDSHYFDIYKAPVRDRRGRIVGLVGLATDVTERRLAEAERLTALRRQRDALVQEVHHRIKNHLQGVAGLLHRSIGIHPAVAGPLRGVLAQIESIAGTHGLQSRLGSHGLGPGQIAEMVAQLAPEPTLVDIESDMPCLSEEEAVPFALTLNELVSNACKHRPAGTAEPVRVSVRHRDGALRVQVSGAPAHLPPGFDFAAERGLGTGLRLVRTLLPSEGAHLGYRQEGDQVIAELHFFSPAPADKGRTP